MYLMSIEELLTTGIAVLVPTAIAYVAWRNCAKRPIAARLFIVAAFFLFLQIGVGVVEQLMGVNYWFELLDFSDPSDLNLVNSVGDELNPGSLGWRRMIAGQVVLSGFDIAAWSLIAWAVLMRPDEARLCATNAASASR